jgi:hypothetical protein
MTDLEKTKKLFSELGIGFNETERRGALILELTEGREKIEGYTDFGADFRFNEKGEFLNVSIYE